MRTVIAIRNKTFAKNLSPREFSIVVVPVSVFGTPLTYGIIARLYRFTVYDLAPPLTPPTPVSHRGFVVVYTAYGILYS